MQKRKLYYEPLSFHAELRETWHATDTLRAGCLDDTLGGTRELSFFLIKWKRMRRGEWKDRWLGIMGNAKEMYSSFSQQLKWDKTPWGKKSCINYHLTEIQNSGVRLLEIKICDQGCTRCPELHSSHRPHPFELASHIGLWGWALATRVSHRATIAVLMTTQRDSCWVCLPAGTLIATKCPTIKWRFSPDELLWIVWSFSWDPHTPF